jgi:2,4-dienoyl-CoA reductase-like NADH-dependent reductase (Old Yellow Enzyme family)
MDPRFPKLFSPLTLRGVTLKNRIFSTGHDTNLAAGGLINDRLVAYHRARAVGGAGLVILQVSGVHESARYTSHLLMAISDESIPGYRAVAEAVHAHGCPAVPPRAGDHGIPGRQPSGRLCPLRDSQ